MEVDRFKANAILNEASKLITEVRKEEHGDSFKHTAALWSAYLGIEIDEADFCILMALLKMSRQKIGKKLKDNFIDGAGYFALAGSTVPENEPKRMKPVTEESED